MKHTKKVTLAGKTITLEFVPTACGIGCSIDIKGLGRERQNIPATFTVKEARAIWTQPSLILDRKKRGKFLTLGWQL